MIRETRLPHATRLAALGAVMLPCLVFTGCAPPSASAGDFMSDNPASRLYAIHRAAATGDEAAVPALVESLDHDDPAVRMMAINALERLTGTRMGYDPYAGPVARRQAADAWAAAVREGRFDPPRTKVNVSSP